MTAVLLSLMTVNAAAGTLSGPNGTALGIIDEDTSHSWTFTPPGGCNAGCGYCGPWRITRWDWGDGTSGSTGSNFSQSHEYEDPSDPQELTITVTARRTVYPGHLEHRESSGHVCVMDSPRSQNAGDAIKVLVLDTTNPEADNIELEPTVLSGTTGDNLSAYSGTSALNPEHITFTIRDNNPHTFSSATPHPDGRHDRDGKFKIVFHYTRFRGTNIHGGEMEEKTIVFENWSSEDDGIEVYPIDDSSCKFKIHLDKLKLSAWTNLDSGALEEHSHCSLYFANSSDFYDGENPDRHNRFWITVIDSSGHGEEVDIHGNPPTRKPKKPDGKDDHVIIVSDNRRPNIYVRLEDDRGNFGDWVKDRWSELFQQKLNEDGTVEEDQDGLWVPWCVPKKYEAFDVPVFPEKPRYLPMILYPTAFNCYFNWNGQYVDDIDSHNFGQVFVQLPEANLIMRNVKVKLEIAIVDNIDGIVSHSVANEYYQYEKPKANFISKIFSFVKGFIEGIIHKFKFYLIFQEATPEDGSYELFFHAWDKALDCAGNPINDFVRDQNDDKIEPGKGTGNSRTLRIKFKVPEKGIKFRELKEVHTGY